MEVITVTVKQKAYQVPVGTTVMELLYRAGIEKNQVLTATLNNHLLNLDAPLTGDGQLTPLTRYELEGAATLKRTTAHMLHALISKRYPHLNFHIGQSLQGGYFYEVSKKVSHPQKEANPLDDHHPHKHLTAKELEHLSQELTEGLAELANLDLPFQCSTITVEAAPHILSDPYGTKAQLLRALAMPVVPIVQLDNFVDIQHGTYAPSTAYAKGARVIPYPPGLILQFSGAIKDFPPEESKMLFAAYREARDWNRLVQIATVGSLNKAILEDKADDVIRIAEAMHEKKLINIAEAISLKRDQLKLICIAGPSSAGKTTFVRRLKVHLLANGIEPIIISLDDYYRQRSECPKTPNGEYDFEALEALDLDLIHQQFTTLLQGGEVKLPKFNFQLGLRENDQKTPPTKLAKHQVLLVEGIHGLNPLLTRAVPQESCYRIYVNALTQLVIDEHNRIFTADARLLRRIVRDRRYRGTSALETIERWPSVLKGERKHIFPFENQADIIFNSTLVYETAILKTFAFRYLLEVPRSHPARVHAYRLLNFLELFVPLFPDHVPPTSVLREFIGGSSFIY